MAFGLHWLDFIIVAVCLCSVLLIGVWSARGIHRESDFFVGGRSLGSVLQFFLNFGLMSDSNGAPTIATEVYRQGVGGIWLAYQTLFLTPFYWFTSVWFRRTRLVTMADLFVDRFDSRSLAMAYAGVTILTSVLSLAIGNVISYKVAAAMIVKPPSAYTAAESAMIAEFADYRDLKGKFDAAQLPKADLPRYHELQDRVRRGDLQSYVSYLSPVPFYIVYTAIVATYIMMGGIKAAAITDALQGILIIAFSAFMVPAGLIKLGGFAALHAAVPDFRFRLFGSVELSDYTWYSIGAIILTSLVTAPAGGSPAQASAKDEFSLRIGMLSGGFTKRLIMITWTLCGLIAIALFPNGLSDPDNAWGALSTAILGPGLMGLMIAGMLLGHMPAVGASVVNMSAMVTRNLYEPLVPDRSAAHYVNVAKFAIPLLLIAGVLAGLFFSQVITIFTTWITFNAFMGAAAFLIYFWRPLRPSAIGIGLAIWIVGIGVLPWVLPHLDAVGRNPTFTVQTKPYTVSSIQTATAGDVASGLAAHVGENVTHRHTVPATPVFFDGLLLTNPDNPASPLFGVGRLNIEAFALKLMGVPVERFTAAGLVAARWLFDGAFPFLLLMGFSYIANWIRPRRPELTSPAGSDPNLVDVDESDLRHIAVGTATAPAAALVHPARTRQTTGDTRANLFFAKLKTPVKPVVEHDEHELALNAADPARFDHLKLFPNSNWEFTKWERQDVIGFGVCWVLVFAILGLFWFVLNIGA